MLRLIYFALLFSYTVGTISIVCLFSPYSLLDLRNLLDLLWQLSLGTVGFAEAYPQVLYRWCLSTVHRRNSEDSQISFKISSKPAD